MTTKADYLLARGESPEVANASTFCPLCPQRRPNWSQLQIGEANRFICTSCIAGVLAPARAQADLAARAQEIDWTGVKSEREVRLNATVWTVLPGTPLTPESQLEFGVYRRALNSITVDFPTPADVEWPEIPIPVYEERQAP